MLMEYLLPKLVFSMICLDLQIFNVQIKKYLRHSKAKAQNLSIFKNETATLWS